MAFIKRLFKNEGEATATDPRLDAQFFNELQDEVINTRLDVDKPSEAKNIMLEDGRTLQQFVDNYLKESHPVGTILSTYTSANPSTTFGGTWVEFAQGRTLVGVDTTQTEFNSVGKEGGEKTHKLTVPEIPKHAHELVIQGGGSTRSSAVNWSIADNSRKYAGDMSLSAGGDEPHNNLQPYITVYFWKRTA